MAEKQGNSKGVDLWDLGLIGIRGEKITPKVELRKELADKGGQPK